MPIYAATGAVIGLAGIMALKSVHKLPKIARFGVNGLLFQNRMSCTLIDTARVDTLLTVLCSLCGNSFGNSRSEVGC